MAVYRRSYTSYAGPLTPAWSRSLVLFRYSRRKLFRSKFQTGLFVLCFFYPLACLLLIYVSNNLSFLESIGGDSRSAIKIANSVCFRIIKRPGSLALLLTPFARLGLI